MPAALVLVALGGAAGSASRAAVLLALPGASATATMMVNVAGAFLLGALTEWAAGGGDPGVERRRRAARLLLGTGFCGGFTTYSAVAVHVAEGVGGSPEAAAAAAGYAVATLVAGVLVTMLGLVLVAGLRRGPGRAAPR